MELVTPVTSLDGDRKYNSTWAKVGLFPKCLMLIAGHSVGPLKPHCLWSTKEKKGIQCSGSSCLQRGWISSLRKKHLPETDFSLDRSSSCSSLESECGRGLSEDKWSHRALEIREFDQ